MELEVFIEWSKGSKKRYALRGKSLVLVGRDRPAPVNYGFIPGLTNPADGEEVDAVLLGPPVPPGSRIRGEVLGLLHLKDGDHKLVLGPKGQALEDLTPLLSWFSEERAPTFLGKEAALDFLQRIRVASPKE
ncbi:MAG: inorganic diphosphatase [Thermaceae bacterium]